MVKKNTVEKKRSQPGGQKLLLAKATGTDPRALTEEGGWGIHMGNKVIIQ